MKRVFEGIVFERRRIGDNAIGACTTEAFEEFYQSLPIGKPTRITVEDLSESKPEPAEPQEWEQRYRDKYCCGFYKADCCYSKCSHIEMMAFIRAEIERVREEEKEAIVAFLRGHWLMTDGLAPMAGDIEQNKHRSEK